jgi:hypothetical protein
MLSEDGHFFIPAPKRVRKEEKEMGVSRAGSRTEFLLLTQTLRPALVTIGVILLAGAAVLLNF